MRCWILAMLVAVAAPPPRAQENFPVPTRNDRLLIVAPHPDDEILGAGGLIQQASAAGAEVRVVYLTNGDHHQVAFKLRQLSGILRPWQYIRFGERRQQEAIAGAAVLGLAEENLIFLGYPDWGTLRIWRDFWSSPQPFRSDATLASAVPYRAALSPGKPYRPQSIVEDLLELIRQFKPTHILVPHPADTNPDHRAAANFVRLAMLQYQDEVGTDRRAVREPNGAPGGRALPELHYYVVHFGRWPRPYHYHPQLEKRPPPKLIGHGEWLSLPLSAEQTERKYFAILEHLTQTTTRHYYLVAFARANEIFARKQIQQVPLLPAQQPLDWRRAVRNRVIHVEPAEPRDPMDADLEPPATIPFEETEFLRQGDELIAAVKLRRRLGARAGVHLYLYAYEPGCRFEELPKLRVHLPAVGKLRVFDGRRMLPEHGVTAQRVGNRIVLRVPLTLLGGPNVDHVFTATRARLGEISADDTAWKLVSLPKSP